MVQQPVIQLVQDLTMTAVVERNDCTDTKKNNKKNKVKSRSSRPRLNTNNAFSVPPAPESMARLPRLFGRRADIHFWVASRRSPVPRSRLVFAIVEEGWREGIVYSNRAASAGHLVIDKVVLRYQ